MKYHITKEGEKIKLCDLKLSHLKNIIKYIEKKAVKGIPIVSGGGMCYQNYWYDEDVYYGENALQLLNYYDYIDELSKRLLNN